MKQFTAMTRDRGGNFQSDFNTINGWTEHIATKAITFDCKWSTLMNAHDGKPVARFHCESGFEYLPE